MHAMKKDIIIVDDEKDIRELISGILSDEGFDTRLAKDASIGFEFTASKVKG